MIRPKHPVPGIPTQTAQPVGPPVNPPPRRRMIPIEPPTSSATSQTPNDLQPCEREKPKKSKRQPTGDYDVGYCQPPVAHRFTSDSKKSPGRPRGARSQDSFFREELEETHVFREGGSERKLSKRRLAAKLFVNTALQKQDLKGLQAVNNQASRLFPETDEAGDLTGMTGEDDERILRAFIEGLTIGEPNPDGLGPLTDAAWSADGADLGESDQTQDDH